MRKKEGRKFGWDLCARVCAGVCFSANVGIQFLCFYVNQHTFCLSVCVCVLHACPFMSLDLC